LLSCIFDGLFGGPCIRNYCTDVARDDAPQSAFDAIEKQEAARMTALTQSKGNENPYKLWAEMGKAMLDNCTVVRHNEKLEHTLGLVGQWRDRYRAVKLSDTGLYTNQNLSFARALGDMLIAAEAIVRGALGRNESRGAHYKPAFAERDDAKFLKATLAKFARASGTVSIEYGPVDTSLIAPRARTYGKTDAAKTAAKPAAVAT
jgi:succinate dehydrogenase / fumarate reductase flavoprotein subunit